MIILGYLHQPDAIHVKQHLKIFLKGQLNNWNLGRSEEVTGEITDPVTLVFDKWWKIRYMLEKSAAKSYLSRHLSENKTEGKLLGHQWCLER